jgi:hypothetical protein
MPKMTARMAEDERLLTRIPADITNQGDPPTAAFFDKFIQGMSSACQNLQIR